MKIVYIITQATWGGAQAHLYSLIKAQVMRGNAVALVYGVEGRLSASVAKEFQDVQVVRVASLVHPIAPLSDLKAIYTLRKLVKKLAARYYSFAFFEGWYDWEARHD